MRITFVIYDIDKIYNRNWINGAGSLNFGYNQGELRTKEERTNNEQTTNNDYRKPIGRQEKCSRKSLLLLKDAPRCKQRGIDPCSKH
jgi:hypothetical protein